MPFTPEVEKWCREFDHLNNDETDNRPENLVLAHRECNNRKKTKLEWQLRAMDKLKENERSGALGEGERKNLMYAGSGEGTNQEIDLNQAFNEIVYEYLGEMLFPHNGRPPMNNGINYTETLNALTSRCRKKTGHGAQTTLRRIVDSYCSTEDDFEKFISGGRKLIRVRKDK